ncbi:MAG TPA: hypothetical protein VLO09_05445, partial [Ornithinimicrobium sp.]|nr:hypothetical protein [Ornithinimicrobium sp.]
MSTGADGWVELAHAVTTCPDRGTADRVAAAAPHLGLTEEERAALGAAVTGREDPAGRYLREVVDHAPGRADEAATTPPGPSPFDEAAMERALDLADALERTPASLDGPGSQDGTSVLGLLEALPAQRAGTLVLALVVHGGPAALEVAVAVAERAPATRMPVEDLLQAAGQVPEDDLGALAAVLARVPRGRLLGALATVLDRAPHPVLARLVELLADRQGGEQAVGAEPPSTGGEPPSTGAEPPT